MRYRKLDGDGDMRFGHGRADFWIDRVEAPAQAILTRLKLFTGEWFLDMSEGTAWVPQGMLPGSPGEFYGVVGMHTQGVRDQIIQERVRDTPAVAALLSYQSLYDPATRNLAVTATAMTIYGPQPVRIVVPPTPPVPQPPLHPWIVATDPDESLLDGPDALLLGSNEPVGPIARRR